MPLDGSSPSSPDLTNYSLEGLAWILRNGNDNRDWYFADCRSCAIGTARARWGAQMPSIDMALGNREAEVRIFLTGGGKYGIFDEEITPYLVADRIDDFRAGRPIRLLVEGDCDLVDA